MKHVDFILVDAISLQFCFIAAFWMIFGPGENPYAVQAYRYLAEVLMIGGFIASLTTGNYKGILRRGPFDEVLKVLQFAIITLLITLLIMFTLNNVYQVSRLQVGITFVLYLILGSTLRQINKSLLMKKRGITEQQKKAIVLLTAGCLVDDAVERLMSSDVCGDHFISKIVLLDGDKDAIKKDYGIPVECMGKDALENIKLGWVDEVLVLQPDDNVVDKDLMNTLIDMGVTVHMCPEILCEESWPSVEMRKLGGFKVLTSSIRFIPYQKLFLKRALDIIGGIVGCILTGILFLFVAPAIYIKDPGAIFFSQNRIGLNGRVFKIFKFRSMYKDAEEKKKEYESRNKVEGGMMFKMDDDPRVIGSEKKDKEGNPKGIGTFIRKTSIDEFPQFWNVLKGDMSLVGTRPPLPDEWEKYDSHHRVRMTVKPGITGLWQVSGRSDITDFEEIVRLDREYIENWSFLGDIRILLRTVIVVLKGSGAE